MPSAGSNLRLLSTLVVLLALTGCSPKLAGSESSAVRAREEAAGQGRGSEFTPHEGEASGTFTVNGETVSLKYAYADRSTRFGRESLIVLVTDKPIPRDALADEMQSQTKLYAGEIRGLEYAIEAHGFWVMFHPGGYQESSPRPMKEFSLVDGLVIGHDEDGDSSGSEHQRSVSFTARLQ